MAVSDPGDEILIPDPGWPNYYMHAVALGLRPVFSRLEMESGYQPDLRQTEQLITPKTRAMVVNTPSNPTAAVYTPEPLERLVEMARRYDIYLISDEVYECIRYEGEHIYPAALDPDDRAIAIYAVSKTYAMTGWRIGYFVATSRIVALMNKILKPFVSCASSISQKAAEAALLGPQDCVNQIVMAYARRKEIVVKALDANGLEFSRPREPFTC
jgi:aspartate/methionine/tyrosine aminotransferase